MRAHIAGAAASVILAAACGILQPDTAGTAVRAQPGGMFNPAATLDTTQVRDRRAYDWTAVQVTEDDWTCVVYYADWFCLPPGMTT